jgi:hypothetical protein
MVGRIVVYELIEPINDNGDTIRRTITITPEYKRRTARRSYNSVDTADEWPVLYRSNVPSLTDAEWYGVPNAEPWQKIRDEEVSA